MVLTGTTLIGFPGQHPMMGRLVGQLSQLAFPVGGWFQPGHPLLLPPAGPGRPLGWPAGLSSGWLVSARDPHLLPPAGPGRPLGWPTGLSSGWLVSAWDLHLLPPAGFELV